MNKKINKSKISIIKFNDYPSDKKAFKWIQKQEYHSKNTYCDSTKNNTFSDYESSFLILYKSKLIGCFQIKSEDGLVDCNLKPWISRLFLNQKYRGHHITQLVLDFGLNHVQNFHYDKIYLSTNHIGLYERFGCKKIGTANPAVGEVRDVFEYTKNNAV